MGTSNIKRLVEFIVYTLMIYCCYITSAIYHEKILKYKYHNNADSSAEQFQAPIIFTLFPPIVSTLIGFIILKFRKQNESNSLPIPFGKSMICSALITFTMWTYNKAIVYSSFSAAIMVKSCSLLSVVLVGVFCSRVKDETLKLGMNKVWIGIVASVGIILFNYFQKVEQGNDSPLTSMGIFLLLVSLLGDGVLPDLQAEIKSQFKPSAIEMYYQINRSTSIIAIAYTAISFQLLYIFDFVATHDQIFADIVIYSILNSIGQLVIYQMIKLFKQHIPSFVIATRKCFTVIVNIIYFGHSINRMQIIAILLVFFAVLMEVYENYKQKSTKEVERTSVPQIEMEDQLVISSPKMCAQKAELPENLTQLQ